jgi:hypothetical protein
MTRKRWPFNTGGVWLYMIWLYVDTILEWKDINVTLRDYPILHLEKSRKNSFYCRSTFKLVILNENETASSLQYERHSLLLLIKTTYDHLSCGHHLVYRISFPWCWVIKDVYILSSEYSFGIFNLFLSSYLMSKIWILIYSKTIIISSHVWP